MSDELLTIRDIVKELDVNEKTVRRWIASGELIAELDVLRRYRVTRENLTIFIARRKQSRPRPEQE